MRKIGCLLLFLLCVLVATFIVGLGVYLYKNNENIKKLDNPKKVTNIDDDEDNGFINRKYIANRYGKNYISFDEKGNYTRKLKGEKEEKSGTYIVVDGLLILDDGTNIRFSDNKIIFLVSEDKSSEKQIIYLASDSIVEEVDKMNSTLKSELESKKNSHGLEGIDIAGIIEINSCYNYISNSDRDFYCDADWYVITNNYSHSRCSYDSRVRGYLSGNGWCEETRAVDTGEIKCVDDSIEVEN